MSSSPSTPILPRLRKMAPYLLAELFLPGGTLLALLLWLSQNSTAMRAAGPHMRQASPRTVAERVVVRPEPTIAATCLQPGATA